MKTAVFTMMIIAMLGALGALAVGLVGMAQGGEFNRKYGNKLMRIRIMMQGLALGLFALAAMLSQAD
jgi:hypothetical protein